MADRDRRLARLVARHARRAGTMNPLAIRRVQLQNLIAVGVAIEDGLRRLGIDPATVTALDRRAGYAAELAALPPVGEADRAKIEATAAMLAQESQAGKGRAVFRALMEKYRDPATPPPDFAGESMAVLLAYVLARAPDTEPAAHNEKT